MSQVTATSSIGRGEMVLPRIIAPEGSQLAIVVKDARKYLLLKCKDDSDAESFFMIDEHGNTKEVCKNSTEYHEARVIFSEKITEEIAKVREIVKPRDDNPSLFTLTKEQFQKLHGEAGMDFDHINSVAYAIGDPLSTIVDAAYVAFLFSGSAESQAIVNLQNEKMTSLNSVISGSIVFYTSWVDYQEAERVGNTEGKILEGIRATRGLVEVATGAVFGAYRGVSIAAAHGASVGAAPVALNATGTALGAAMYLLLAIPFFVRGHRARVFYQSLQKIMKETPDKDEALQKALEKIASYIECTDEEKTKFLEEVQKKYQENEDELKKGVFTLTDEECLVLSQDDVHYMEGKNLSDIEKILLQKAIAKAKMCKRDVFKKDIDDGVYLLMSDLLRLYKKQDLVEGIKNGMKIRASGSLPEEEKTVKEVMEKTVREATSRAKKRAIYYIAIGIACVLTALFIVGATVFSGGIFLIIAAIIGLLGALGMLVVDGKYLIDTLRAMQQNPQRKETVLWAVILALVAISMVLGIIFSGGGLALIIICVVGSIMLLEQVGLFVYAWIKKKSHQEEMKRYFGMDHLAATDRSFWKQISQVDSPL